MDLDPADPAPDARPRRAQTKRGQVAKPLAGKTVALIFEKPSTRTRVTFEVGIRQLGGDVVYLNARDMQSRPRRELGRHRPVLSRYVDAS